MPLLLRTGDLDRRRADRRFVSDLPSFLEGLDGIDVHLMGDFLR